MNNPISGALRLNGFDKPTVWTIMTPLAVKTQSINLGQGFPSWQPPDFFLNNLQHAALNSNHQYVRAFGSLNYTKAVAQFHKPNFGEIDHQNEIFIVNGGVEGLYCVFTGLVNPGEEVILFDPSYDCYRPQVQMAGGKCIGIPLIPKKNQSKEQLLKKIEKGVISDENDEWNIDFEAFEKALNEKTRILLINSPHNPLGKVFTNQQLLKIASILQKFPQVVVLEDNVYEGMTYDETRDKPLPKIAYLQSMKSRTISIYSAGKLFSATGIRSGWVIGPAHLIKAARSVHQYNVFCQYSVVENAVANSLEEITKPNNTYVATSALKLQKLRDLMIKQLIASPFDFDIWIPKGGYFILVDISRVQVMEKYFYDENGGKRTKDYAFAYQLAMENKIVCIPISPFYDPIHVHLGEKYVRFAFCKTEDLILEASKRLKK